MDRAEEFQFERFLLDAVEQAKKLKYQPQYFIGMIGRKGAFQTVKDLVASSSPSEGFFRLRQKGRIDLTCEAIIVETKWRSYFDDDLLAIAEQRLTQYGYTWRRFSISDPKIDTKPPRSLEDAPSLEVDDFQPPESDLREHALRMAHLRDGQTAFREALLLAYEARCCITGVTVAQALEAAHISAYRGEPSNHVQNGILLRADLHKLYDRLMFSIDPSGLTVRLAPSLIGDDAYGKLEGTMLTFGKSPTRPSRRALALHWGAFNEEHPPAQISHP